MPENIVLYDEVTDMGNVVNNKNVKICKDSNRVIYRLSIEEPFCFRYKGGTISYCKKGTDIICSHVRDKIVYFGPDFK